MFHRLSYQHLQKSVARAGVVKQVEATRVLEVARRVLAQYMQHEDAKRIRPVYVKNRTLALEIAHPAVGYMLQQQEKTIIGVINEELGRPEIIHLQFLLPQERYSTFP